MEEREKMIDKRGETKGGQEWIRIVTNRITGCESRHFRDKVENKGKEEANHSEHGGGKKR